MDSTLAPCSTATLTYNSSGLLSVNHNTTTTSNSPVTSVLPVSPSPSLDWNLQIEKMLNTEKPTAILRCNSMPFEERILDLGQSVMVGRAVARYKPSNRNAIFDCKVLSRNHALLWYDNGKFYLQDTKSSNGTFVNQQRLSYANTESEPKEVFSGDVVQFGVDVVDNTRKVSHGCVIATLELYLPGGEEAPKRSPNCGIDGVTHATIDAADVQAYSSGKTGVPSVTSSISCHPSSHSMRSISIPIHRLLEIETSLKEALTRESALEHKLCALQKVLKSVTEASEKSWKSMVEEDRLLSRIELLESKLKTILTCNNYKTTDEKVSYLKEQIEKLHFEREIYESNAKESLLQSNNKFMELNEKFLQLESDLELCKEENNRLIDANGNFERQLNTFGETHEKFIKEYEDLVAKHKICDETISKLKSEIDLAASMGSTSTFTKSREVELENQLAEMEKQMQLSLTGSKKIEDTCKEESDAKLNALNDELTLLRKKLIDVQEEHKLCKTINLNGTATSSTISTTGTNDENGVFKIEDSSNDLSTSHPLQEPHPSPTSRPLHPSPVPSSPPPPPSQIAPCESEENLVKIENLQKQLNQVLNEQKESLEKVQSLSQEVENSNKNYNELLAQHNECLNERQELHKQIDKLKTCHKLTQDILKHQISDLKSQICQRETEGNQQNQQQQQQQQLPVDSSLLPLSQQPSPPIKVNSEFIEFKSNTLIDSQQQQGDISLQPVQVKLQHQQQQLQQQQQQQELPMANVLHLNPLDSYDMMFNVGFAIFFIVLLYYGSPSLYSHS